MEYNFCYLPHYCNCPEHELIKLDPKKLKRYEREGYPKFISGHNSRVKHPFLGKHHTPEAKEKNRQAHLGNKNSEGHKVSEENKQFLSELHKDNQYAKGCIHSEESKLKQSESMLGNIPWNKGLAGVQESPMKGKHHSISTIQKIKQNTPIKSKSDHWNWQGGKTPLYKQIRYCDKYTEWRLSVFKRDNFLCHDCKNSEKKYVITHHIKQFSEILQENNITSLERALQCDILWDISNGTTLCKECHDKIPRKKNFFED